MKGYLERMAASAAAPSQRLRPAVLPRYAAGSAQEALEAASMVESPRAPHEDVTEAKQLQHPVRQERETLDRRSSLPLRDDPQAVLPVTQQSDTLVDQAMPLVWPTEPLLRPAVPEAPSRSDSAATARTATSSEGEAAVERIHATEREPLLVPRYELTFEAESRKEDLRPLATGPSGIDRTTAPIAIQPRSPRRDSTQPLARPAARQAADDVQIHIGRIEVIAAAAQQPAARAAVPQKALRLEDYLKRRDRRAR